MSYEKPRNRRFDKNGLILRIWHESSPWLQIIMMAVLMATAWQANVGMVSAHETKNQEQDVRLNKLEEAYAAQVAISARIEQKVDYVREDTRAMRRAGDR